MKHIFIILGISLMPLMNIKAQETEGRSVFGLRGELRQQNNYERITIIDTVVIKKRTKDSVKLRVQLSGFVKNGVSKNIYMFYQYTPALLFVTDSIALATYKAATTGLNYVIEDKNGAIIEAQAPPLITFKNDEDIIKNANTKEVVNTKTLKQEYITLANYEDIKAHELSELKVVNDTSIYVYPLLSLHHKLPKGKYKMYLFYSFNNIPSNLLNKINCHTNIYKGTLLSNKIDLIVK